MFASVCVFYSFIYIFSIIFARNKIPKAFEHEALVCVLHSCTDFHASLLHETALYSHEGRDVCRQGEKTIALLLSARTFFHLVVVVLCEAWNKHPYSLRHLRPLSVLMFFSASGPRHAATTLPNPHPSLSVSIPHNELSSL